MHCPDCGKETEEKDTQPTVGGSRTFFFCSDCEKTWAKEWNDFDQDFSIERRTNDEMSRLCQDGIVWGARA